MTRPCVLTVAGSDCGGGAGVQADLKTFAAHGVYGLSVIAALTAQNTRGVLGVLGVAPDFVGAQLDAVLGDFTLAAAKTGMLFCAGAVAETAKRFRNKTFPLVVDPVCVSGSGRALLEPAGLTALRDLLIPLADCLTPNLPEAEALTGLAVVGMEDMLRAGQRLLSMGVRAALLKGGHADAGPDATTVTDILFTPGTEPLLLSVPRVRTKNTHGTGCALSAAIAAGLAKGLDLISAVTAAQRYLNACLRTAWDVGHGQGPPDHLAGLSGFR
ncbi:MAG: bifunctional hydroxymethylpyrimidine kinase/phosphomethylpyrimidine kinase [Desulfovibrionaceae bacterium]|nr:bifunctional hydroxymethylpyrimidine kinase/phosphomethylpyrimidine kinase [Desulfovibrionaceae bacterium]MBF0515419.1 bifunctional hydroxymethylpyrimidine kinase/phosphomethylpyrimidine kinase [Desulfovibrionaceae bacterium]